jgi:hypothetical protein
MADDVDALFRLPLDAFTAARNSLAADLKKAGRTEDAARVKALAKPSVSAWGVNQLYWQHPEAFERLMKAGERFRTAQAAQLAGQPADVRGPLTARRDVLADLSRQASTTLSEGGHRATPDLIRRLTMTLEAISAYGTLGEGVVPGRLTADVDPPGFDSLAALVPQTGKARVDGPSRLLSFARSTAKPKPPPGESPDARQQRKATELKAARATAQTAVTEAARALRAAQKELDQAETRLKKIAARVREDEKARAAAEALLERVAKRADAARTEARTIAATAETAAQVAEEAEHALERARAALKDLE